MPDRELVGRSGRRKLRADQKSTKRVYARVAEASSLRKAGKRHARKTRAALPKPNRGNKPTRAPYTAAPKPMIAIKINFKAIIIRRVSCIFMTLGKY